MRILSLTPGTGGTFYCQNCLRDGQMVRALRRLDHDITVVPLYLPILLDAEGLSDHVDVFFGGVNVYLQQQTRLFRSTPRWLDKMFDSAWMLRKAAAREGSTRAADLGPMTYSMLQGRHGRQRKELERLLEWLKTQPKPDVVLVSNALLLGLAREIRETLGSPVVCSLQDEDTWVDAMDAGWRERCWDLMAEKAKDVDAFMSVSRWYTGKMVERLRISPEAVYTVPLGIECDGAEPAALDPESPVIGYLSRIHESQGFSALVDAFIELKRNPKLKRLRLRATGGVTSGDVQYVKSQMRKLAAAGVVRDVEIVNEFNKEARREFIRSVSVVSAPSSQGEAFGLFILEAGSCGVPVVQPDAGAFREVVEMTGGGIVYDPGDTSGLVKSLERVLTDTELARNLGRTAREAVCRRLTSEAMAENMSGVLTEVVSRKASAQ